MFNVNGYQVKVDINMIKEEKVDIKRSWWERLFSWTPMQKTKTIIKHIPSTDIFVFGNTLIMHPTTRDAMIKAMEKKNGEV